MKFEQAMEKTPEVIIVRNIVFKSFGSHEFHDRILRLKAEGTADFLVGIFENL